MDGVLVFAFTVGAVSSVNPCGFALLPAFFARRLGADTDAAESPAAGLAFALLAGGIAALGVVLAFGIAGGAVLAGVSWLGDALPWAGLAVGAALIVTAIYVLFGHHIGLRVPLPASWRSATGLRGDFLFGFGYGVASLSCTLPIFLGVTGIATTGSTAGSFLSFVAFGLGMGTVITAIAVAAALSRNGLAVAIKKLLPYANRVGGIILLLAGLYVVYYWGSELFSPDLSRTPDVIARGNRLSGQLVSIVGGTVGKIVLLSLLAVFAVGLVWTLWWRRKHGAQATAVKREHVG